MTVTIVGARLQGFTAPQSLGVVRNTKYVRCFWPRLDEPTPLFAKGSNNIIVEGPPTPRNVVFPVNTTFVNTRGDCLFIRDEADEQHEAEEDIEAELEVEPGIVRTVAYRKLVTRERKVRRIIELTADEARDLINGNKTAAQLRQSLAHRMVKEKV